MKRLRPGEENGELLGLLLFYEAVGFTRKEGL
jgi:hypothetical protein